MPFSHKSLALVWLGILGLVALAGSGASGLWLLALVAAALVMPALIASRDVRVGARPDREVPPASTSRAGQPPRVNAGD